MAKEKINKISENVYEIGKEGKMIVPVRIYASEELLKDMEKDQCLQQGMNVAMLPGIQKYSIVLPDAHQGYGFSIGGVAAFDLENGIISPGGIGFDINCSIRLLRTNLTKKDIQGKEKDISKELYKAIPSGVGKGTKVKITKEELKEIMKEGAKWAVDKGYGNKEDYEFSEESGCMKEADPSCVSDTAISRGINQLGSIGAGNHFLELQYVEKIFDKETAEIFGLEKDGIVIMIHCGSRGFGHQIASDYMKLMEDEYGFANLPDRQLICAPINSKLGKEYYKAMCAAANFAFCNKQVLTHLTREALKKFFPDFKAEVVYDICHNIGKFEEHNINGKKKMVLVHRKGATRSYGPGKKELPKKYQITGQPIIIPGSMGTASYVLVGTKKAEELSFASTAHGAGRMMSRNEAMRRFKSEKVREDMEKNNIAVTAGSWKSLVEEASQVYKNVDDVVKVSDELGIGNIVARMRPMAVIKG
ncbi:RtcB family protein [Candidatus Pacearchaeota archaeon]|nr:RtcB family protein [Candidatus Pacearchaeota archaeon]